MARGPDRDDSVDLALRALFAAADEDAATGGPDLVRRIFPTIAMIDATGSAVLGDDDIEQRAEDCSADARRVRPVSMPFYVSPEQVMKDRADYARKGIARGRSLVALSASRGSSSSPRTRRARCTRSARSTTASLSPASASTTSSRCCGSPVFARPT